MDFFDSKLSEEEAEKLNPLVLSFVGDSVFSLYVRKHLVLTKLQKIRMLHDEAAIIVSAKEQSKLVSLLENYFDESERAIFLRARNAKSHSQAKNSSITEYRRASGIEAVFGFLFLTGKLERLDFLLSFIINEN